MISLPSEIFHNKLSKIEKLLPEFAAFPFLFRIRRAAPTLFFDPALFTRRGFGILKIPEMKNDTIRTSWCHIRFWTSSILVFHFSSNDIIVKTEMHDESWN